MSSKVPEESTRLHFIAFRREQDVVLCRKRARSLAAALHFDRNDQVRIATAVSEIARNAFRYGSEAKAEFLVCRSKTGDDSRSVSSFAVVISDQGPGIDNLPSILAGTYKSRTGAGAGIRGAKRLMGTVHIDTGTTGTTVRLEQRLPKGVDFKPSDLHSITGKPIRSGKGELLEDLGAQNQAFMAALDRLSTQDIELEKINEELSETNRGVVALYDELDTVQRVGRVIASKLDLGSLVQAITDATVEVSGAECGGFFRKDPRSKNFSCQTVSGPLGIALENCFLTNLEELTGSASEKNVFRFNDLVAENRPFPLSQHLPFRSFLALAVPDSTGAAAGALVFAHRSPGIFTERTERILSVVAVQVAMGLENAQLYFAAQAASAAKDQFLAVLSHELRTPLTPIFAVVAAMQQYPDLSEKIRSDLLVINRNLQLEARLIDDLLDLTRISKGKISLRRETTDVHILIRSVVQLCLGDMERQQIGLTLRLEAERWHVSGDPGRLQQVLWNLLNNAVKFCGVGGKIKVRTSVIADSKLQIEVADEGRGIPPDLLKRIFQPFEQGDISGSESSRFGGLGLGLAISKFIVEAHQGEIWAQSPGVRKGATFIVSLPLAEIQQVRGASAPSEPAVSRTARILLVDDHEDTLVAMARILERFGHEVVAASTYTKALELGQQQRFDLVISDLGLQDGSGYDLMSTLRAVLPVKGIALSGYGMKTDIDRSLAAGFSAHLVKPCSVSALTAAIEKVLSNSLQ